MIVVEGAGLVDGTEPADLTLLGPRQRRGLGECARFMVAAARAALGDAGMTAIDFPVVSGSSLGEIQTAEALCEMRSRGDGRTSPARFRNSVHNTVTGLISIASASSAPCTAVAAGPATVAAAILEAQLQVLNGAPRVLVVVGDESVPPVLDPDLRYAPIAGALVLAQAAGQSRGPTLELTRVVERHSQSDMHSETNPALPMVEIVNSLRHHRSTTILLPGLQGPDWSVQIGAPHGNA